MAGGDGTAFEKQVLEASERLAGIAELTPLQYNPRLSADSGANVWFKREDLQVGRSYKLRGAYNLISQLDDEARAAGVVCASAGNHAQGFAFACQAHRSGGACSSPPPLPARSASGSRRSAGTWSTSWSRATPTTRPPPRPPRSPRRPARHWSRPSTTAAPSRARRP